MPWNTQEAESINELRTFKVTFSKTFMRMSDSYEGAKAEAEEMFYDFLQDAPDDPDFTVSISQE